MGSVMSEVRYAYESGMITLPPEIAVIEITNRCNLNCVMCYRLTYLKEIGDMDFSLFKQIVKSIKGAQYVCCQGGGEPLLHPQVFEMIEYAHKVCAPKTLTITTNGTVLTREMARKLASSKLSVLHVSIDGSDKETYERIRGFDFDQVVANVRYFKSVSRIPTVIQFTVMKENLQSLLGLPRLVKSMGAEKMNVQHLLKWNDQMNNMRVLDGVYDNFERVRMTVLEEAEKLGIECSVPPIGLVERCDLPFRQVYFNFKGEIAPCCVAIYLLLEKSYSDINGERIRDWRRRVGRGDFPEECRRFCYVK